MDSNNPDILLASFSLGDSLYAVDIMRIREILLPQKLSVIPGASQILEGVINLRGEVIPVMSLRERFGMPEADDGISGKLLIVSLARQALALAVDNVMEIISVPASEIKLPPDMADGIGKEYLLGVCLADDRVYMILDIDSLLTPAESRDVVCTQPD